MTFTLRSGLFSRTQMLTDRLNRADRGGCAADVWSHIQHEVTDVRSALGT